MKKKLLIVFTILLIVLIGFGLFFLFKKEDTKVVKNKYKFIYLGSYNDDLELKDNYVFSSYEEFIKIFKDSKLSEKDFENNNYILIPIKYDYCSEQNIKPISYKIDGNKVVVNVEYEAHCGVCPLEYMYYLIKVSKDISSVDLDIKYKATNDPECDPNVSYKPIIYLYPEQNMNVVVKLGKPSLLTTTYPLYNGKWEVLATTSGELFDKNGRSYYGLYWEGLNYISSEFEDGFVVKKDDLATFLEEKLSILGLTEREANEFIIYWLPELEKNEYTLIRFESLEKINEQMPLDINPNPDTIIRVFMEFKAIDKPIDIKPQNLTKAVRKGFTVVEWGGTKITSSI